MIDKHDAVLRYQSSVGGSLAQVDGAAPTRLLMPYRRRLTVTDALLITASMLFGLLISSRASAWAIDPTLAIYGMPVIIGLMWWLLLALRGSYDQRVIGLGTEEIRRIVSATLLTFAIVAGTTYLIRADISRAYAIVSLPLGLAAARRRALRVARLALSAACPGQAPASNGRHRCRPERGRTGGAARARCLRGLPRGQPVWRAPATGSRVGLPASIGCWPMSRCDAIALAPSEALTSDAIHQLAWRLEGRHYDLLIAPAVLDIAGPRLTVRPAAGLPLLHLDEAVLSRPKAFVKRTFDLAGGLVAVAAPASRVRRGRAGRSPLVQGSGDLPADSHRRSWPTLHHAQVPHHGRGRGCACVRSSVRPTVTPAPRSR